MYGKDALLWILFGQLCSSLAYTFPVALWNAFYIMSIWEITSIRSLQKSSAVIHKMNIFSKTKEKKLQILLTGLKLGH